MNFAKSIRSSSERGSQITIDTSASSSFNSQSPPFEQEVEASGFPSSYFKNEELECLSRLKEICQEKQLDASNQLICRFAIFHGFNVKRASRAIAKNHDHPYLNLRLEEELAQYIKTTKTLFPLPGLKSAMGSDVIYWHPSSYLPSASSNRLLVESMCYLLNDMNQTIDQCRNGILMIVNMDGYKMKNFHRDTQMRLTKVTEGQVVPTSIVQILIVNPPTFFETIWKVVRPAFSSLFSKRIHFIKSNKLGNYLMEGYEADLPDDFVATGRNAGELVERWLAMKKLEE
mmetsp:Transcript_40380/g.97491  ORF Transcript_40380/g.97491 Transcript_40380/m.97491 type:complete len:287 (-) Transcript_40380:150-1010(-)